MSDFVVFRKKQINVRKFIKELNISKRLTLLEKSFLICLLLLGLSVLVTKFISYNPVNGIFSAIGVISYIALLIILNYQSVWLSAIGSIVVYMILISLLDVFKLFSDMSENLIKTKSMFFIILFFYCILIFNVLRLVFQVVISKKKKNIHPFLKEIDFWKKTVIITSVYILLIVSTIFLFACIYEAYNSYGYSTGQGLYYSASLGDTTNLIYTGNGEVILRYSDSIDKKPAILATSWEPLYFSTVTFFTVGYGDIIPIGEVLKVIVQVQMILGHLITFIFAAFLISGLQHMMIERINEQSEGQIPKDHKKSYSSKTKIKRHKRKRNYRNYKM